MNPHPQRQWTQCEVVQHGVVIQASCDFVFHDELVMMMGSHDLWILNLMKEHLHH